MLKLANLSANRGVFLAYTACALIWGTGWYAIRLSVGDCGFPLLVGAACRYTIAALVLIITLAFFPGVFNGLTVQRGAWLVAAGLLNALGIGLLYWGEREVSGGMAAILSATSPLMAACLASSTRCERVTAGTITGFAVALAGVAIIFGERLLVSPSHILYMFAILASALVFAAVNQLMKLKAAQVSPLQSALVFFVSMSAVFWLATPLEAQPLPWPPPPGPALAIVFLALGSSVIALPAFFYLLRKSSLMFASTLSFVNPLVALLTDSLFERDFVLSSQAYVGMVVVLGGLMLSGYRKEQEVIASPDQAGEAYAS